jgi:hypothetical protein
MKKETGKYIYSTIILIIFFTTIIFLAIKFPNPVRGIPVYITNIEK